MERRLKAQNAAANITEGDKVGPTIPNTNVLTGSNPLYDGDQVLDDDAAGVAQRNRSRSFDASSLSSGDSVLIGVENKDAFANYAGHKDDISADDLSLSDNSVNLGENVKKPFEAAPRMSIYLQPAFEDQDIQPPVMRLDGGANPLYQSDTDA